MNMASALGLANPTIEGRIILTAENKTGEGFEAARKQLDEFAKEAAKVQTELNTHKRTVLRQQREHLKDAEKVGKTAGEMFKNIVAGAAGAFATLHVMLEHFDDVFRATERRTAERSLLLRTTTNITENALMAQAKMLAQRFHTPSTAGTADLLASIASRGLNKFEATRRFNTLMNVGAYARREVGGPEQLQEEIQQAIRSGRTTAFPRLLSKIYPNYYPRFGNRQADIQMFESMRENPAQAEKVFYQKLDQLITVMPEIGKAWEETNKASETYNDKLRALTALSIDQSKAFSRFNEDIDKVYTTVIDAFLSLPDPIRHAVEKMVLLTEALGGAAAAIALLKIGAKMLAGPVAAAAVGGGLAAAGSGAAATGRGLIGGAVGSTMRLAGRALRVGGGAMLGYEVLSQLDIAKGGDGSLASIVRRFTGKNPDTIKAAPYGPPAPPSLFGQGRDLMSPWLQMNRTKDDRFGNRSYVPSSFGYDPRRYRGVVLPPGRQHGGSAQAGAPYIVGESHQREMFIPNSDGSVAPIRSGSNVFEATRNRVTIRQFNQGVTEATSGIRHFTDAIQYSTMILQKISQGGGGPGGGGLGGGFGGGGRLGGGFGGYVPRGLGLGGGGDAGGRGMSFGGIGGDRGAGGRAGGGSSLGAMSDKGGFLKRATPVMAALQRDLGISKEQAAGIVGSLKPESGLRAIQEGRPISGRGGFGWAQWTASRRVEFENYARSRGLSTTSDEANYGFLLKELRGKWPNKGRFLASTSAEEAAHYFTGSTREKVGFLRPGAEHYSSSEMWARRSLEAYNAMPDHPGATAMASGAGSAVAMPLPSHAMRRPRPRPGLAQDRDPLNNLQTSQSLHLGRGAVDVNLKLDRQLAAAGPASVYHASNFDLGVNVDRTGHPFSRPGDPAFPPPPSYG